MNRIADHLSRRGIPYGVRRDGSVFVLKDEWRIVELGTDEPDEPTAQPDRWALIDARYVLMEDG